jgi:hypothetical protein
VAGSARSLPLVEIAELDVDQKKRRACCALADVGICALE